jgi:hypothetical protein
VKGGFRTATLGVVLALSATVVMASYAKASFAAENPGAGDRSEVQQKSAYEKNHFYNLGNREGYGDHKKRQHTGHNREFPNDDDRRAYEDGYKKGWEGKRAYRIDRPLSNWARVSIAPSTTQ